MANIEIITTSIVQATSSKPSVQKIELTPCELMFLPYNPIQKGLLFHKPKSSTFLQHLISSLSTTLNFFFPLAGRLKAVQNDDDNTICFFVDCNNAGVLFVHAVAHNLTISDILGPIYVPSVVHSFSPLNGTKNYQALVHPLAAFQVTELDDGIFIGCTMNHSVADGFTFWNFMNSWSEISRGLFQITKPPVFEHVFRSSFSSPIRLPFSLSAIKALDNGVSAISSSNMVERIFHFSKEKIAGLKEKAKTESGCERISSLQSILGHLWRSVIRNEQNLDPDRETRFRLQISIRTRIQPPVPDECLGSVTQTGTSIAKAREILENGIGYAALKLNQMIGGFTEEKIKKDLETWVKNPKLMKVSDVPKNALAVSSSPRFNVYGNDFGWGRPIAVRSGPGNKFVRKITLFPGAHEDGSVDIEVNIDSEIMKALENDAEFMNAVTV